MNFVILLVYSFDFFFYLDLMHFGVNSKANFSNDFNISNFNYWYSRITFCHILESKAHIIITDLRLKELEF